MSSPAPPTSPPIRSAPSTPRHNGSPAADGRFDLTPRSKIKAMLAAFDDSDEEEGGHSPRARTEAFGFKRRIERDEGGDENMDEDDDIAVVSRRPRGLAGKMEIDANGGSDSDEDDKVVTAVIRKPRGIAGRMEVDESKASGEQGSDEDDEPTPIKRNRIRKATSPKPKTRRNPFSQKDSDDSDSGDDAPPSQSKSPTPAHADDEEHDPTLSAIPAAGGDPDDEDELPDPAKLLTNPRFAALVASKRKERKEKEAAEARVAAERRARAAELDDGSDDGSDDSEGVRALEASQMQPRQRRAAGKKAMAEMARETQRMARGMQLAHEARTKKRIGKEELFAKFGFRQPKVAEKPATAPAKQEDKKDLPKEEERENGSIEKSPEEIQKEKQVSTTDDILNAFGLAPTSANEDTETNSTPPPPTRLDKGKGRAIDPPTPKPIMKKEFKLPPVKVAFSKHPQNATITVDSDGDSDIEIIDPAKSTAQPKAKEQQNPKYAALQARKLAILETQHQEKRSREMAKKEADIFELRKRAGNTSNLLDKSPKPASKAKMNPKQLAATLLQQSRLQALRDREEKIAELRAKGVIIQTAEERLKDAVTVEEQIEKARLEAERIKKREKKERKLEAIRKGETVSDDDSDEDVYQEGGLRDSGDEEEDADWVQEEGQEGLYELSGEEAGDGEEEEDVVGSGSEDGNEEGSGVEDFSDEEKQEDEDMDDADVQPRSSFIEDEAGEDEEEEEDKENRPVVARNQKSRRKSRIVDDDEDDDDDGGNQNGDSMDIDIPTPVKSRNPFAAFGGWDTEAPMGLTQAFEGTMADFPMPSSAGIPKSKNPFAAFRGVDTEAPMGLTQAFLGTMGDSDDISASKPKSKNPFAAFPDFDADAPMGLTQAFAGTIADDSQDPEPFTLSRKSPARTSRLDILRKPPVNALGNSQAPHGWDGEEEIVKETQQDSNTDMHIDLTYDRSQAQVVYESEEDDSAPREKSQASFPSVNLDYSQSQFFTEEESYNTLYTATQLSQFPNPTPDMGFEPPSSPIQAIKRFDTPKPTQTQATQATKVFGQPTQPVSPLVNRKKGRRLLRATERTEEADSDADAQADAFAVMKKAAKAAKRQKAQEGFDKKNSEAKKMVQEQAEESEDEWAGIGGAEEPEEDEDDEKVRKELGDMIDDTEKNVDRNAIKAYYAEREREDDAKHVSKLFKDLQNGGLRRKRGAADFDLSDSEDEIERRRANKRRNEARLRKLLLEDNKISQIAANPKQKAFFECLQDNDVDDSMNFLDQVDEDDWSQGLGLDTPTEGNERPPTEHHTVRRLTREDSAAQQSDSDTFAKGPKLPRARISGAGKKRDLGLREIREQLSFLVEDEDKLLQGMSDDDDDDDEFANWNGPIGAPDTTTTAAAAAISTTTTTTTTAATTTSHSRRPTRTATVIDRISLKRSATLESTTTNNTSTKLAFHAPDNDADPTTFRVPGLLRRATTNSQLSTDSGSTSNTGMSGDTGGGGAAGGMKKSGAKGSSSINYHQRERESQRARVVGKVDEKRRRGLEEERKRREGEVRRVQKLGGPGGGAKGVAGLLAKGGFE